ncbi:MvdC/MvdD family ATP grasp protein [Alistipes ihumii]|uniref:MvdC/MvdD family ATP grasp protein n=1 Tax=Alistipes ihumii TaxID=1470347 RepID=UPI003AEFFEA3
MILIITNKEDAHPTPVIKRLSARGVPVFRLNTEALLTDYEFKWSADASHCDFWIRCKLNGFEIRGCNITAVWDRRPDKPTELLVANSPQIDKHNLEEALGFLVFLRYYIKDIPSIGSIVNDRPAASKMLQYHVAHEIGFLTPRTCFSNRKACVQQLADQCEQLIVKPIESNDIWDEENNQDYVFYAQRIPAASLAEIPEEAFSQTVSFVQEYIEKDFELRVTVVGDQVFACKIMSQEQTDDTGKIDWRQGYDYGLKHERYELPPVVSCQCIAFLQRMGLNFGCFDFVVTPSGEYVFLECNPNGQWLWVELETGLKISDAIADFLVK